MTIGAVGSARRGALSVGLCFVAALVEGYDLQVAGVTAPALARALNLHPGPLTDFHNNLTWVLGINTFGLFVGAALGGTLADRLGRKWLLTGSMIVFAVFTLGTALAPDYGTIVVMRFLTGLGLGGAMPNLIALVSEAGSLRSRAAKVTLVTGAISVGGALASVLVYFSGPELDWRHPFYIGAAAPALVAVLMIFLLPESAVFLAEKAKASAAVKTTKILFSGGRAPATILLWLSYLLTLVVLYLLLNWLTTLMAGKGYSGAEATLATLFFGVGGAVGAWTLGLISTRERRAFVVAFCYCGMGVAVATLAYAPLDLTLACAASFGAGFFVIGTQFLLYGMAPEHYAASMRGTGVGWAVAVGRVGAFVGPLLPGIVGADRVLFLLLPFIGVAGLAGLFLSLRQGEN